MNEMHPADRQPLPPQYSVRWRTLDPIVAPVNSTTTESTTRKPILATWLGILGDCRDIAIHRLLISFGAMLDRVARNADGSGQPNGRARGAGGLPRGARCAAARQGRLLAEFERRLRVHVDDRIAGKVATKTDFAKLETEKLTLIDTHAMDEAVVTGNITRVVENLCHEELQLLNRGIGHLLGQPDLETDRNPFAPAAIVEAFAESLQTIKAEAGAKFTILKELNRASLVGNQRHLRRSQQAPAEPPRHAGGQPAAADSPSGRPSQQAARPSRRRQCRRRSRACHAGAEIDVMELFRRRFGGDAPAAPAPAQADLPRRRTARHGGRPAVAGGPGWRVAAGACGAALAMAASRSLRFRSTAVARYVPGDRWRRRRRATSPARRSWLRRCWARASRGCRRANRISISEPARYVQFSGIPEGKHNVLRDLQQSSLGKKANQLESMTIELVAMLFDFIFETKDLPDGIKALLARLQIPVLKAAMLDGALLREEEPSRRACS